MTRELYSKYGLRPELPVRPWDNSFKSSYVDCKRYAYLRYILARVPEGTALALAFGKAWHRMQDTFHTLRAQGGSLEFAKSAAEEVADTSIPEEVDDRYGRTRSRIKEAFEKWLETYLETDDQLVQVVRSEQPIEVTCLETDQCVYGGCGYSHSGVIDKLIRAYGNRLWIRDYKTSVSSDRSFAEKYMIDPQVLGYIWMGSHIVGERVHGVVIDFAVINSSKIEFTRHPLMVPDYSLQEWLSNMKEIDRDIESRFERGAYDMSLWTQSPHQCHNFGMYAGLKCMYFDPICSKPAFPAAEARLVTLSTQFREERHNIHDLK